VTFIKGKVPVIGLSTILEHQRHSAHNHLFQVRAGWHFCWPNTLYYKRIWVEQIGLNVGETQHQLFMAFNNLLGFVPQPNQTSLKKVDILFDFLFYFCYFQLLLLDARFTGNSNQTVFYPGT